MLNKQQQQVVEFLKSKSTKTHFVNEKSLICFFDNTKIIEFDFVDENEICLTFDETDVDCECQTSYTLDQIVDERIDHILSFVDSDNTRLKRSGYVNKEHSSLLESLLAEKM